MASVEPDFVIVIGLGIQGANPQCELRRTWPGLMCQRPFSALPAAKEPTMPLTPAEESEPHGVALATFMVTLDDPQSAYHLEPSAGLWFTLSSG